MVVIQIQGKHPRTELLYSFGHIVHVISVCMQQSLISFTNQLTVYTK